MIKKIYNKICVQTHPDKTKHEFKHYLFIKAKKAYISNNVYKLILISNILNIKISNKYFNPLIEHILLNEIKLLNEKTNKFRLYV